MRIVLSSELVRLLVSLLTFWNPFSMDNNQSLSIFKEYICGSFVTF